MWEKTYNNNKKDVIPNRYAKRRVETFKCDLESQILLRKLSRVKQKSKFINRAIKTQADLDDNFKGFLVRLVQLNYGLVKHILRQIGRARKQNKDEQKRN